MQATSPKPVAQAEVGHTAAQTNGAAPRKPLQPKLTQQQLETHLWGAANILRGKTAGQDYKNYILSLMFYKRLCDQWAREADEAIAEVGTERGQSRNSNGNGGQREQGHRNSEILQPDILGGRAAGTFFPAPCPN